MCLSFRAFTPTRIGYGLKLLWLTSGLIVSSCHSTHGPIGFWSRNRFDEAGRRQGPWHEYYDAAETIRVSRGRYQQGRPVGRWTYTHPAGHRWRKEQYRQHGVVNIRDYHPNGKLAARGQARLDTQTDTLHYYWFGTWQRYDTTGQVVSREIYQQGVLQGTELVRLKK
ncbi:hypothetical protein [Hymenobacter koreensis]|uniref:Toxin-antitoxin system YwqK family antitoxin n=1 Tax=Hymenobacter koreensis TaxID=1084523 RepID=A0ABP8JG44_9BACT